MIDFDKLFEKYFTVWYNENKDKYKSVEDAENDVPNIYLSWLSAKNDKLDGKSPQEFFDGYDGKTLVNILIDYSKANVSIPDVLCDKIVDVASADKPLVDILNGEYKSELKILAANLLNQKQSTLPLKIYVEWITGKQGDNDLIELALEILTEYADIIKAELISKISGAEVSAKKNIADVLVNSSESEEIYNLLMELFLSGEDVALYAAYLGKYGDKRALPKLTEFFIDETISYIEYQELKNSIEMLGGIVNDLPRDFSEDAFYKALKNVK